MISARGPFSLDGERALFERLACDVLVSKNSGSQATEPKLQVAREMGLPVLVLARPALPPADREFADGEALLTAIRDWEAPEANAHPLAATCPASISGAAHAALRCS